MAQLRRFVQHGLPEGVVHVLLLDLVEVEEARRRDQIVALNRLPQGLVPAIAVFFEVGCRPVDDPGLLAEFALLLHLLQCAIKGLRAY